MLFSIFFQEVFCNDFKNYYQEALTLSIINLKKNYSTDIHIDTIYIKTEFNNIQKMPSELEGSKIIYIKRIDEIQMSYLLFSMSGIEIHNDSLVIAIDIMKLNYEAHGYVMTDFGYSNILWRFSCPANSYVLSNVYTKIW